MSSNIHIHIHTPDADSTKVLSEILAEFLAKADVVTDEQIEKAKSRKTKTPKTTTEEVSALEVLEVPKEPEAVTEDNPVIEKTPAADIPDREAVRKTMIRKTQAGGRQAVKDKIEGFGVSSFSEIPEGKLAEFNDFLESLEG